MYISVRADDRLWRVAPEYARLVFDGSQPAFDDFIYLHGGTCSNDIGLTMTLAHELQHFIQHGTVRSLWAVNSVAFHTLMHLERDEFEALGLRACDIPTEREARIVAKQIAERLFGVEAVRSYIEDRKSERVTTQDAMDWDCIQGLDSSTPYDLATETRLFFPRIKSCRSALERTIRQGDVDFQGVNLDAWFVD